MVTGLKALGITHILNAAIAVQQFPKVSANSILRLRTITNQSLLPNIAFQISRVEFIGLLSTRNSVAVRTHDKIHRRSCRERRKSSRALVRLNVVLLALFSKIIISCSQVGMSRSATLVIAYLMHAKKTKYMEAFAYTVERRYDIISLKGNRYYKRKCLLKIFSQSGCEP